MEKDLEKENQEKIWQEGILRHVPVFGSVYNWLLPVSSESGVKGRSLDLSEGELCKKIKIRTLKGMYIRVSIHLEKATFTFFI